MGQGGYIFCEWDSIQEAYPRFRAALKALESRVIGKCTTDWFPKKTPAAACGYLNPRAGEQFGRTSILPALFKTGEFTQHNKLQFGAAAAGVDVLGFPVLYVPAYWRQTFIVVGHQGILYGAHAGDVIPEDFKIAWMGLAFPNKEQNITEIRFQIGDRKYGRINLEEMLSYNKPALVFEEGFILNEEESFDMHAFIEGPLPEEQLNENGESCIYQRVIPIGAAYYKVKDKVLGAPGSTI